MFFGRLLEITIVFFSLLHQNPKDSSAFISPVRIPLALSANFGELRPDHYHSGLDIKTQGVTGKEIVATESGYVYRISVSPGGFGRALYLKHPSGYSTVYGHLDRFTPEIEEYVITRQYEEKSFLVNLFPPVGKFEFNQGDIIAYSGNSGSSSGPHLHYEIRKSDDELPLNPLLFDFGITDKIKPAIERLLIYPAGNGTLINNQKRPVKLSVTGRGGNYFITAENEIVISGPAGFGIKAYDLFDNSTNKCAVYSLELFIDSTQVFNYKMDSFSFNESKFVNSHIDYETYIRDNIYIENLFVLPNDRLSVYSNVTNRGLYNFRDNRRHHIRIIATDIHKNRSSLTFYVRSATPTVSLQASNSGNGLITMPYGRNNRFVARDVSVSIPSGALYDTIFFDYKRVPATGDMYSDVHQIHNIYTPLHKAYTLAIKPGRIPEGKASKLLIVRIGENNRRLPVVSTWSNGNITANLLSFGNYFIGIDTLPPVISANGLVTGANLSERQEIRFRISDNFSGIKSYEPSVDGKWALFEYDQKNNVLIYRFDPKRIAKGTKHYLTLTVTDNTDNISTYKCDFIW